MKTGRAAFSWLFTVFGCGGSILLGSDPLDGEAFPDGFSSSASSSGGSSQASPAGAFAGSSSGAFASSGVASSSGSSNPTSVSSSSGVANSDGSTAQIITLEPTLPTAIGACPVLTSLSGATVTISDPSGPDGGDASAPDGAHAPAPDGGHAPGLDSGSAPDGGDASAGQTAVVWSGQRQPGAGAPILFYWHGSGSTPQEVQALMTGELSEITSQGGLVAAFASTTGTGTNTSGNALFSSDDFKTADQIVACAVQQLNIDVHRIYAAGCDSGGLQAGAMLYYRSSYLAAAMPNSGGIFQPSQLENPRHVPALITAHGAPGTDLVILDFSQTSLSECADVKSKGGLAVDCNHGGGHCGSPADLIAAQWQFCKDHPFGLAGDPYRNGLPPSFPSYCVIQ